MRFTVAAAVLGAIVLVLALRWARPIFVWAARPRLPPRLSLRRAEEAERRRSSAAAFLARAEALLASELREHLSEAADEAAVLRTAMEWAPRFASATSNATWTLATFPEGHDTAWPVPEFAAIEARESVPPRVPECRTPRRQHHAVVRAAMDLGVFLRSGAQRTSPWGPP